MCCEQKSGNDLEGRDESISFVCRSSSVAVGFGSPFTGWAASPPGHEPLE